MNADKFTDKTNEVISNAFLLAKKHKHIYISPLHVGCVIFNPEDQESLGYLVCKKLSSQNRGNTVDCSSIHSELESTMMSKIASQNPPVEDLAPNRRLLSVLQGAEKIREQLGDNLLAVDHLLLALMDDSEVQGAISKATSGALTKQLLKDTLSQIRGGKKVDSKQAESGYDALNRYGIDLVEMARQGKLDPVIGRDNEIRRVIRILSRRTKNNPVIIGEPGVGKTAIVEALAQRIVKGDVPQNLNCKLYSIDLASMVSGTQYRGAFEERLKSLLAEVEQNHNDIILFVDEVHTLVGTGATGESAMDASNMIKPLLARGMLRLIGATTLKEYKQYIEKDAAFERRFQPVYVTEPSVSETISIMRGLKERYEAHHGVRILDSALVEAARLSDRFIQGRMNPDKSIDLIDEACANIRVQLDSRPEIIDTLERKKLQLEMEVIALEKEKTFNDEKTKMRLEEVKREISKIDEELTPLKLKHEAERSLVNQLREKNQKLEQLKAKMVDAERRYDLALASDLKYGAIPEIEDSIKELKKKIEKQEQEDRQSGGKNKMVSDVVGSDQICEVVSRWTGIPVDKLNQSERERLLNLEQRLHQRVIGQDEAVTSIAEAIIRSRAGLSNPNKPTGSFMFCGPSGIGKTSLAKALAYELFDDEKHIVRIDMSEYMEQHAVSRLIGSPPGYVGFEQGGQLTEAVRRRPYNVILFDEVEKAHPRVLNVLLQILDEGRLTDGQGRTVDFKNTVIILTSNIGSTLFLKMNEENEKKIRQEVMDLIKQNFTPEFLNRLDDILFFKPLDESHLLDIVRLQVAALTDRLKENQITIDVKDSACKLIIAEGYDKQYGARPLQRYIQKHIVTELSKLMVGGELKDNSEVTVQGVDGKFRFTVLSKSPEDGSKSKP